MCEHDLKDSKEIANNYLDPSSPTYLYPYLFLTFVCKLGLPPSIYNFIIYREKFLPFWKNLSKLRTHIPFIIKKSIIFGLL